MPDNLPEESLLKTLTKKQLLEEYFKLLDRYKSVVAASLQNIISFKELLDKIKENIRNATNLDELKTSLTSSKA